MVFYLVNLAFFDASGADTVQTVVHLLFRLIVMIAMPCKAAVTAAMTSAECHRRDPFYFTTSNVGKLQHDPMPSGVFWPLTSFCISCAVFQHLALDCRAYTSTWHVTGVVV